MDHVHAWVISDLVGGGVDQTARLAIEIGEISHETDGLSTGLGRSISTRCQV